MTRAILVACLLALAVPGCFGDLDPDAFDIPRSEDRGDVRDGEGGGDDASDVDTNEDAPEAEVDVDVGDAGG